VLLSLLFICTQTNAGTADPELRKALAQRSGSRMLRIIALLVLLKVIGSAFYLTFKRKKVGQAVKQEA